MNKDYTHITVVMDKSGSMAPLTNDTINGYNGFLQKQKELPGKLTVSLLQFSTTSHYDYRFKDIHEIPLLNYFASGGTALYDAISIAMDDTGNALRDMPESVRPSKVIFAIITDGEENSSKMYPGEYGKRKIKEQINHQQSVYNWEVVFLGSNLDVVKHAEGLGLRSSSTLNYSSEKLFGMLTPGEYVMSSYSALGSGVSCARNASDFTAGEFFSNVGLTEEKVSS